MPTVLTCNHDPGGAITPGVRHAGRGPSAAWLSGSRSRLLVVLGLAGYALVAPSVPTAGAPALPSGFIVFEVSGERGGWLQSSLLDGSRLRALTAVPSKRAWRFDSSAAVSRDGRRFAFVRRGRGDVSIYVRDVARRNLRRVVALSALRARNGRLRGAGSIAFSVDGRRLAFSSGEPCDDDPVRVVSVGGGRVVTLAKDDGAARYVVGWTPDGAVLFIEQRYPALCMSSGWEGDTVVTARPGSGALEVHRKSQTNLDATLSPDGRRLATIELDGALEVLSRVTGERRRLAPFDGGASIAWSSDGSELLVGHHGEIVAFDATDSVTRTIGTVSCGTRTCDEREPAIEAVSRSTGDIVVSTGRDAIGPITLYTVTPGSGEVRRLFTRRDDPIDFVVHVD